MSAAELFREIHHKKMLGTKAPNYEQAHVDFDLLVRTSYNARSAIRHITAVITENTATTLVSDHPHSSK